jgi:surface protein
MNTFDCGPTKSRANIDKDDAMNDITVLTTLDSNNNANRNVDDSILNYKDQVRDHRHNNNNSNNNANRNEDESILNYKDQVRDHQRNTVRRGDEESNLPVTRSANYQNDDQRVPRNTTTNTSSTSSSFATPPISFPREGVNTSRQSGILASQLAHSNPINGNGNGRERTNYNHDDLDYKNQVYGTCRGRNDNHSSELQQHVRGDLLSQNTDEHRIDNDDRVDSRRLNDNSKSSQRGNPRVEHRISRRNRHVHQESEQIDTNMDTSRTTTNIDHFERTLYPNGNFNYVSTPNLIPQAYLVDDKDYSDDAKIEAEKARQENERIQQRLKLWKRTVVGVIIVLLLVAGIAVGVVFSTRDYTNKFNNDSNTVVTDSSNAIQTTEELYQAVDIYIASMGNNITILNEKYGFPINGWNVSLISNFSRVFDANRAKTFYVSSIDMSNTFNEDISDWDVSSATTMFGMFASAVKFNQDLSKWDVRRVTNMANMFVQACNFNQNLSKWDVGNVQNMSYMFYNATAFQGDVSTWNTNKVMNMSFLFACCESMDTTTRFTNWDTSSVTSMTSMFRQAKNMDTPDLSDWNVSNVRDMSFMFLSARKFNGSDISNWDVHNVEAMSSMFNSTDAFSQDISKWDVTNVVKFDNMFLDAKGFRDHNLCDWGYNLALSFDQNKQENNSYYIVNTTNMFINSSCSDISSPVVDSSSLENVGPSWCSPCTTR